MIQDSIPWQKDLLFRAEILRKLKNKKRLCNKDLMTVETTAFIAFYIVRKLMEAKTKLSSKTLSMKVSIIAYPTHNQTVTLLNWHKVDELYDSDHSQTIYRGIRFICNQLVHSYIFMPIVGDKGGLDSILFTSDRDRTKYLYELCIEEAIDLLEAIGNDRWTEQRLTFNPDTGDYDVYSE